MRRNGCCEEQELALPAGLEVLGRDFLITTPLSSHLAQPEEAVLFFYTHRVEASLEYPTELNRQVHCPTKLVKLVQ